jgi:hypothetical protein
VQVMLVVCDAYELFERWRSSRSRVLQLETRGDDGRRMGLADACVVESDDARVIKR